MDPFCIKLRVVVGSSVPAEEMLIQQCHSAAHSDCVLAYTLFLSGADTRKQITDCMK